MPDRAPRRARASAILLVSLLHAACTGGGGTLSPSSAASSATASPAASLPPTPEATPPVSEAPTRAPTVAPTPDIGPFACSFPVEGSGTVTVAHITDVRVGEHDGYDRIVFEFDTGIPTHAISEATPPIIADPSGLPLEVQGSSFWQILLTGGTKMMPDGTSSYTGPTDLTPGFAKLVELVEGGDFEAVSTWYAGLSTTSCVRVLTLDGPPRLVIDVEH